jgi:methyl-accepting chemotaxis protein
LKIKEENGDIVGRLESISSQIQLLALNIAVAAAKIAHKQDLGLEVNQGLSQLVNQATQAVKQMNQVLNVAGASAKNRNGLSDNELSAVDNEMIESIESSMESIIADSEKITRILSNVKKGKT